MENWFTDCDGSVWEVINEDSRYVTLRNPHTGEVQEVSHAELRECFDTVHGGDSLEDLW